MLRRTLSALALSSLIAAQAAAVPLWGTRTDVGIADMFPSGGQNNFSSRQDGPTDPVTDLPIGGAPVTHSLLDDSVDLDARGTGPWNRGAVEASAALQFGAVAAPASLRARAVLTGNISNQPGVSDASALAEAFASDLFEYTGATAGMLSITFTLTGSIANAPLDPTQQTVMFADVAVFATTNYDFTTDRFALVFNQGAVLKAEDDTTLFRVADSAGGTFTLQTTLSFTLAPGEQFYVWQKLGARAAGDARSADAYSTMTASFDQPSLVRSLAVPEPTLLALFGIATLALCAKKRRSP